MVGGCVTRRFGAQLQSIVPTNEQRDDARALAGGKPRAVRDPHKIKRNRKALTRWTP